MVQLPASWEAMTSGLRDATTLAAAVCSSRRMFGISERGTSGSKPPASPSVTMQ